MTENGEAVSNLMSKSEYKITYKKNEGKSFFQILYESFRSLQQSHFIAFQFAKRDINTQFRQSILGLTWVMIIPLLTAGVWILLQQSNTIRFDQTKISYALHVLSGILAWSILTESIVSPTTSILNMRGSLSKINFPKEALLLSGVYKTLFNSGAKIIVLLIIITISDLSLFSVQLMLLPIFIFLIILFGNSIGLLLTPFSLLFNDVQRLVPPAMSLLMYLSPVVYAEPKNSSGLFNKLVYWNPISPLIVNFRSCLYDLPFAQIEYCLIIFAFICFFLCLSLVVFRITMPVITERISS